MTSRNTSTMYEASLNETGNLLQPIGQSAGHVRGAKHPPAAGARARTACDKSCGAFGYGPDGTVFAHLEADGADATDAPAALDPKALFALVEGLDPLCVVCADRPGAEALSACYRTPIPLGELKALFGRPSVAFDDLDSLLGTDAGKQEAWAALKQIPKFHER